MARSSAPFRVAISCLTASALACAIPSAADASNGHWQPPDVFPSTVSLQSVFDAYDRFRGTSTATDSKRLEHFSVTAGSVRVDAVALVRDADFVVTVTLPDGPHRMGRTREHRWRNLPSGVGYRVYSDSQGDDLDRWPLAVLGFDRAHCTMLGETKGRAEWVVEDRPSFDVPHWYFVDEKTGAIVREMSREGSTVVEYSFSEPGTKLGATRPMAWTVRGGGPDEQVVVTSVDSATPSAADVAEPAHGTLDAISPPSTTVDLPVHYRNGRIDVDVTVDGVKQTYILDNGTPTIDVPAGDDHHMTGTTILSHGSLDSLDVGPLHFAHVPVRVLPTFGSGILGYDFFTSGVIEVDYTRQQLHWTPRESFVPPSDAVALDADFQEALPLVPMSIGGHRADRFVPDLGSFDVVLLRYFSEVDGASFDYVSKMAPEKDITYLEGGIHSVRTAMPSLAFGYVRIDDLSGLVEIPNDGVTTDFPVDGIVGVNILSDFDWWFDEGGSRLWYRPRKL